MQALETLVNNRWDWFVSQYRAAGEWWKKSDGPVRYYLLALAADGIAFGERYQSLPSAAFAPYEELVSALVSLSKETKRQIEEWEEKEAAERERQRIEKECAEEVGKISYSPPASLEPRVLDGAQRQAVKDACVKEIMQGPQVVREVAGTIDEFASFCVLLAEPNNRIKARHANTRTEADMVNEMARVFTGIPKYTAYAKVVDEKGGKQIIWKGQVRTKQLSVVPVDETGEARRAIEANVSLYTTPRAHIREEIDKRQAGWRARVRVEKKPPAGSSRERVSEPENPMPPTHFRPGR